MSVGKYTIDNLVVLTIDDLEDLESSVQSFGLCELLAEYGENCPDRVLSLHNYVAGEDKYKDAMIYSHRIRRLVSKALEDLGREFGQIGQETRA